MKQISKKLLIIGTFTISGYLLTIGDCPEECKQQECKQPETQCGVEFCKGKIRKVRHLAYCVSHLSSQNIAGHFTKVLEEWTTELCYDKKEIKKIINDLERCEIVPCDAQDIDNEWVALLQLFFDQDIDRIIHLYHPQGCAEEDKESDVCDAKLTPTQCDLETIKLKIGELKRMAHRVYEDHKVNEGRLTQALKDKSERLCEGNEELGNLIKGLGGCEISQHNMREIYSGWISLLKLFFEKDIDYIINLYHPRGYC
jgi:hypothetical protein